jgi:toxoflavin biosynthesis protein ToxD
VRGGSYLLGDEGAARRVRLSGFRLARHPVLNAQFAAFAAETRHAVGPDLTRRLSEPWLADHPVTGIAYAEAVAFCRWAAARWDAPIRLPTGDEWEAAARCDDGRAWPWGTSFDPELCNSVEAAIGFTVAVGAHPAGAAPCGAEQLAGNVWEWTADRDEHGWQFLRGGSWLDSAWGVRAARALPADPGRGTATTGFRLAADCDHHERR